MRLLAYFLNVCQFVENSFSTNCDLLDFIEEVLLLLFGLLRGNGEGYSAVGYPFSAVFYVYGVGFGLFVIIK